MLQMPRFKGKRGPKGLKGRRYVLEFVKVPPEELERLKGKKTQTTMEKFYTPGTSGKRIASSIRSCVSFRDGYYSS